MIKLLPFEISKHLRVAQEFTKIYVKQMTRSLQHNIVIMTITDAEYVSRNAVAGAGNYK